MKVGIKRLSASIEVKSAGVEFQVYDNESKFLGDLVVSMTKLVWCPGKTTVAHGHAITWADFITYMLSLPKA